MDVFDRITDWFIRNEVIPLEDKELYTYGLKQGSLMVLNIGTIIIIGIILKMIWQSILLMFVYIPLRTYAGGYHARTGGCQGSCHK
ncbi:accessory gene regulator B family protein [Alkalibaculum bacchi]|uniref:accessory gene regulator B family protein n=1 Tax=Alkalibaculum bacchi TaxID=645887 RepID=UPI0026EC506F|nr:accessory gene regulator B family protein [Alkalibaculum bacchi]